MDADTNKTLFSRRGRHPRSLASNTKLFTSAAVLGRYGAGASLATTLLGDGSLDSNGTWKGSIYLRGGGDPTFGSRSFARRAYGSDASVEVLADQLDQAGFKSVTGSVVGRRVAVRLAPRRPGLGLRHLDLGRAAQRARLRPRARELRRDRRSRSSRPSSRPRRLDAALKQRGIQVRGKPRTGTAPDGSVELAEARSPDVARLLKLQNKHSDNYFAEMLVKGLPMAPSAGGSLRAANSPMPVTPTPEQPATATPAETPSATGTTKGGARASMAYARSLGVKVNLVDGSGLSRSDRAAPREVAHLLDALRDQPGFNRCTRRCRSPAVTARCPTAMRSGPARGHCHAKTGTLTGVSALSGYCTSRSGRTLVFSVLNTGMNLYTAHSVQDQVAQALAGWGG